MIPEFEEAVSRFQDVLKENGLPSKIVWVAPEHTIFCQHEWKVFRGEGIKADDILAKYQAAREKSFGIRLGVLCRDGDTSYCYLYAPTDELNAEIHLLANHRLKISIPVNISHASLINRGIGSVWFQLCELRVKKWKYGYFGINPRKARNVEHQ